MKIAKRFNYPLSLKPFLKSVSLSVALVGLVATGAMAQFSLGLKAGLNVANQTYSMSGISISPSSLTGFHGGLWANFKFGKFGLQPEAYYSTQGSSLSSGGVTSTNKFNYINIPILLRYNITNFLNLHAGPQFGLLASAKSDGLDVKSQVKSLDFSAAVGAGFDLPFGLMGGLRYCAGLTNIDKTNSGTSVKNSIFQIYVGYRLIGK
jgi:hypothetical protein